MGFWEGGGVPSKLQSCDVHAISWFPIAGGARRGDAALPNLGQGVVIQGGDPAGFCA